MPPPSEVNRRAILEEETDDWLLGYLANTKVGADPKINAASQRVVEANKKRRVKAPPGKGLGSGLGGALFGRGVMRRSSWAAGPSGKPLEVSVATAAARVAAKDATAEKGEGSGSGSGSQPTLDASALRQKQPQAQSSQPTLPPVAPQGGGHDVVNSSMSRMAMLQAGSMYHKSALQDAATKEEAKGEDSFSQWAASGSTGRERRMSSSIGGGARISSTGGPTPGPGVPNQRRMSTSRLSMSGRRQSMDYSELDAVKQRLQHATTLWAVEDDEDTGSTDDDEDKETPAGTSQAPETAAVAGPSDTATAAALQGGAKGGLFGRGSGAAAEGGAASGNPAPERKGFLKFLGRGKG